MSSSFRVLQGQKVTGAHLERLVQEAPQGRWGPQENLVLGLQGLKDSRETLDFWVNQVNLDKKVGPFCSSQNWKQVLELQLMFYMLQVKKVLPEK